MEKRAQGGGHQDLIGPLLELTRTKAATLLQLGLDVGPAPV